MTTTEADGLPYPENRGQTHYEGCYRERHHHNCAVRMVEELEAENERLQEDRGTVIKMVAALLSDDIEEAKASARRLDEGLRALTDSEE